ncbi:GntR family transcriptional regulator [Marinobacterium nitratireducens]|uniref:GntR family transcriptional regulator n=1 Tax=Marinobacterium nitratireducens TaxID=518897 RepID=A0A917ZJZ5_9GAMM|nr:GntR family transcriptional regulator [Marinobacterium nitratireducens]GGO83953.1 GntR family transcriptional regulator [Marinobacterium nitratireducens]
MKEQLLGTRTTRYAEVAQDLERQIAEGQYAAGSLLPTEAVLCQDYDVSRFTARSALKILEDKGLIERQQGRGSVVLNARPSVFRSAWSTVDELLEHAEQVRVRIESSAEVLADEDIAAKTGFAAGQRLLQVRALRYFTPPGEAQERPLCTLDVWIHEDFMAIRELLGEVHGSIIGILENRFGKQTAEVQQSIAAVIIPDSVAAQLDVEPGQAALRLRRKFYNTEGKVFEASETVFPSSLFEYQMRMKR